MEFKDIVEAAIAVLALIISAVALVRTRRFEEKQIAFQETADRLTRLQTELLEREEKERRASEQQAAIASAGEELARADASRREAERIAVGSVCVHWVSHFGEERLTIKNDGQVPVRDVRLIASLASGQLPAPMRDDLAERFPVPVLAPAEETFVRANGLPGNDRGVQMRVEWSTVSGRYFMQADRRDLYAYNTEIRRVGESC